MFSYLNLMSHSNINNRLQATEILEILTFIFSRVASSSKDLTKMKELLEPSAILTLITNPCTETLKSKVDTRILIKRT